MQMVHHQIPLPVDFLSEFSSEKKLWLGAGRGQHHHAFGLFSQWCAQMPDSQAFGHPARGIKGEQK